VTLEQFLDTWASLVDYIIKNGKLPDLIQDLVNLGFELYSTTDGDNKTPTIPPSAFEHLFQKMTLGRPFALMAYKFLTEVYIIYFCISFVSFIFAYFQFRTVQNHWMLTK